MKIKKFTFLLLALLVGGVNALSAKELKVDLKTGLQQVGGGTATFTYNDDGGYGIMEWDSSNSNNLMIISDFKGDLYEYDELRIETEEGTLPEGANEGDYILNKFRIVVKFTNGAAQVTQYVEVGSKTITWNDLKIAAADRHYIEYIYLAGTGAWDGDDLKKPGNIKIKSISLYGETKYIEASESFVLPKGTLDLKDLKGTFAGWANTVTYPKEFAVQGEAFGNGDGGSESEHVTIPEDYDYINFNVTDAQSNSCALRVWIWDNAVVTLYPYPISEINDETDFTKERQITAPGTYAVKVSGYKYLKGVKAENNWGSPSVTVFGAYLSKEAPVEYVPSGEYVLEGNVKGDSKSLTTALADESAVLLDVTKVTNEEPIELISANPNCIIKAKAGQVTNTENVLIDGTIANLSLTDGFPVAVPTGATADAATYTRAEMNTFGTICLPYAATAGEGEKFYTIDKIEGDLLELNEVEGELAAGTPAIVEKLGGEGITISGSGALASVAEVEGSLKLVGTLVEKTILASESQLPIYAISENKFVKATETITLPAFRAYFTAEDIAADDAPAKLRLGIAADDATAIGAVAGEGNATVVGIYSVNGAEQKSLQKGVNIIKMSDGTVQKVLVK
ncbi:MAG: hypothetical protein J1F40_08815 [Prevotellaceae bacterium]|nr:hypothetical protein [Prevotellaceae bacterium]